MRRIGVLLVVLMFGLTACVTKTTQISTHMEMRITKAYFNEFILPNDSEAKIEAHLNYYKFLKRFNLKGHKQQVYLFAWEVDEESLEWELTINEEKLVFAHQVTFIVFNNNDKKFSTVEEAIEHKLFSFAEFKAAIKRLDIYINN